MFYLLWTEIPYLMILCFWSSRLYFLLAEFVAEPAVIIIDSLCLWTNMYLMILFFRSSWLYFLLVEFVIAPAVVIIDYCFCLWTYMYLTWIDYQTKDNYAIEITVYLLHVKVKYEMKRGHLKWFSNYECTAKDIENGWVTAKKY